MSVKRIAVGGVLFEGNTFSKVRTELVDFENKYLVVGDAMIDALGNTNEKSPERSPPSTPRDSRLCR